MPDSTLVLPTELASTFYVTKTNKQIKGLKKFKYLCAFRLEKALYGGDMEADTLRMIRSWSGENEQKEHFKQKEDLTRSQDGKELNKVLSTNRRPAWEDQGKRKETGMHRPRP